MKKIIFSDIHGNMNSINKVEKLKSKFEAEVIFLGDLFDRGNQNVEVLEYFYENRLDMKIIMGNHDEMLYLLLGILTEDAYLKRNTKSFQETNFMKIYIKSIISYFANNGDKTLRELFPQAKDNIQNIVDTCEKIMYQEISVNEAEKEFEKFRESVKHSSNFKKLENIYRHTVYYYLDKNNILFSHSSIINDTWAKPYSDIKYYNNVKMHIMGHQKIKSKDLRSKFVFGKFIPHKYYFGNLGNGRILIDNKKCNNVVVI